jgi:hypothetical protein
MNKHTNSGGMIQLSSLVGASPQSNRYLVLLSDLPATPDSASGASWVALETDFTGYSRPRIDNKMSTPAANGSVVETSNSTEIRISATGSPTAPIKAYAICNQATGVAGSSTTFYAYGLFDRDINPS